MYIVTIHIWDPERQAQSEEESNLVTIKVKKKRQRRQRKRKLRYLRQRLANTRAQSERQKLIEKIRRISPRAPLPDR